VGAEFRDYAQDTFRLPDGPLWVNECLSYQLLLGDLSSGLIWRAGTARIGECIGWLEHGRVSALEQKKEPRHDT
jgi:hypothetical protein